MSWCLLNCRWQCQRRQGTPTASLTASCTSGDGLPDASTAATPVQLKHLPLQCLNLLLQRQELRCLLLLLLLLAAHRLATTSRVALVWLLVVMVLVTPLAGAAPVPAAACVMVVLLGCFGRQLLLQPLHACQLQLFLLNPQLLLLLLHLHLHTPQVRRPWACDHRSDSTGLPIRNGWTARQQRGCQLLLLLLLLMLLVVV